MKKSRTRPAMRSVSAPPKLAVLLLGGGLNLLRYSTLHAPTPHVSVHVLQSTPAADMSAACTRTLIHRTCLYTQVQGLR